MICPNNFAKEVARASGRKMPDVSDELIKNGFDSVKKGDETKRINKHKFSSNKIENDNLNSLHNSSDEMLQMAADAGEYEKVFKKEARGIHNVMNNGKKSTLIKRDLDSIDSAIKFERGFNNKNNKGYGAKHIIKHTINKDAKGYITDIELVNLGKNIREYIKNHKEPFIDKNGARIYEWENSDGVRFRAVVGDIQSKAPTTAVGSENGLALRERIITFYSDRNLKEPMNFKNPNLNQLEWKGQEIKQAAYNNKKVSSESIETSYHDTFTAKEPLANQRPNSTPKEIKSQEVNIQPIKEFGTNYAEFYHDGVNAIKKLLAERQGQVAGAFEREELGDIDLVWGEVTDAIKHKGYGLSHILDKRMAEFMEQGLSKEQAEAKAIELINKLPDIIKNGQIEQNGGRFRIQKDNYVIGLTSEYKGEKRNWIITAFERGNPQSFTEADFIAKSDNLLTNPKPNSTTTANKSQENILKGVDGKEYPNTIAGRWEKRVDEAFEWAYKNIYAKGVKSGIKGAEFAGRAFGSQETGAKIQRGLEKTFALQDEIGALNRLKSAYLRNSAVARVEAMKVYESLVKLKIDERVALFRMLDGQEVEPNLAGKLRPTYQKLRDKIDERAELLIKLGMLKGQNAKENYIKYSYSQYYDKKDVASKGFSIGKLKARNEDLSYEDSILFFFFFKYLFITIFIFGCTGSSLLCAELWLRRAGPVP